MQFTESIYIYQQNRILQKTLTWLDLSLLLETKDSSELHFVHYQPITQQSKMSIHKNEDKNQKSEGKYHQRWVLQGFYFLFTANILQ